MSKKRSPIQFSVRFLFTVVFIGSFAYVENHKAWAVRSEKVSPLAAQAVELVQKQKALLLDVRSESEYKRNPGPKGYLVPISQLPQRMDDVAAQLHQKKNHPIVVYCESGGRSAYAIKLLKKAGFTNIYDLKSWRNWPNGVKTGSELGSSVQSH